MASYTKVRKRVSSATYPYVASALKVTAASSVAFF